MGAQRLLVVDDEESMRFIFTKGLSKEGYEVDTASSGKEALEMFQKNPYPLIFMDIKMPGKSGLEIMEEILRINPDSNVIVMTAEATMQNAINAMKKGAYDYLVKPFDIDEIILLTEKALEAWSLKKKVASLQREIKNRYGIHEIIGKSGKIQEVFKTIGKIADTDLTVLIRGESGTGKELIARTIHFNSKRVGEPFIVVNCAAIPSELLESELFGHEKGAFTHATEQRIGKFEQADKGTIFLDEIGDMDVGLQSKILRVIQEKEIERVGGKRPISINVRIIAATHEDIEKAIEEKRFREDLYYRLNVVTINLPPLSERQSDIPLLAEYFIHTTCEELDISPKVLSPQALNRLKKNTWKGNIRELENTIKRAVILSSGDTILPEDLPIAHPKKGKEGECAFEAFKKRLEPFVAKMCEVESGNLYEFILKRIEEPLIEMVLDETRGNQVRASQILGINRNTLRKKIKELKIMKKSRK